MSSIDFGPFHIEYSYIPGDPGAFGGGPDDWRPPESSEFDVTAVRWNYSAIGDIAELLDDFFAPIVVEGDQGAFLRANLEAPDGHVPHSIFNWWMNTYQDALHEAIDRSEDV